MKKIVIYLMFAVGLSLFFSCTDKGSYQYVEVEDDDSLLVDNTEETMFIPVSSIKYGDNTRALYRFQSENLNVTRWYQLTDYVLAVNPNWIEYYYNYYRTKSNNRINRLYYRFTDNGFSTVSASKMAEFDVTFKTSMYWQIYIGKKAYKVGGVQQKIQDEDTIMLAIFDKNNPDVYYSPEWYDPSDTTIVQGLTAQAGTKADCFSRQVPWVRYPKVLFGGTHVWRDLTAYYWLQILYDSTKVASIDTVHMHAEEGLASKLYFKYDATVSMDCTIWDGPYAIGVDTMFALKGHEYGQGVGECNKRADVFISFFPGLKTNNIFHNFGFDVSWTGTDGTKHSMKDPMNQENVRPQAKVASPGNVYRDAMTLTLEHGLQNMWEDEVIEIDKWNTKVDSTIIIKKD